MSTPRGPRALAALAVLLAMFAAGALAGVAWERLSAHRGEGHGHRGGPSRVFDPDGALGERLDLTPAQRRQIERILRQDRRQAQEIFHDMRPRLRAQFDATTARIRALLTPEQRDRLDRYLAERRQAYRERRGGRSDRDEAEDEQDEENDR